MKKKTHFLLIIVVLSIILMGNSQVEQEGVKLKNFSEQSTLNKLIHLKSSQQLGQIIILPNGPFDEKEAAEMISRLDRIPESLLTKINQEGIKVKLFTGKLTDNKTAAHLSGEIPRGYVSNTTWDNVPGVGGGKTVLVKIGYSDKGMGHSSVNLEFHELAHSIDRYVYQEIRNKQEFTDVWNKEKNSMFPTNNYLLTYPEEYFAECFAYYYLGGEYRESLKQKAPQTYELMKGLS